MYATIIKSAFAFVILLLTATAAVGQVATGTYPYGTFDTPGIDTINVGNLNVHLDIPILHKAGRGVPFVYDLTYDNSIWTPVTSGSSTQWQPVGGLGWDAETAAMSGYVTASSTVTTTPASPCNMVTTTYLNYVYHDSLGRMHPFNGNFWSREQLCDHPPVLTSSTLQTTATDGSGFSIVASAYIWTVTSASGAVITGPVNGQSGAGVYTDPNGNEITANTNGQFTDTTGNVVLTVAGTAPSPTTFVYKDSSGNSQTVTMSYTAYTMQTHFGVTGINEYPATNTPLVSSIEFPDGSSYSFTYEETPTAGNCTPLSGTYSSYCVTGRLASITTRTGGTISYQYTGGSNGIESDGSTAGLTRTQNSDSESSASTWTYNRTITGTKTSQTAITDGLSNNKTFTFVEASNQPSGESAAYYETSRNVYKGAATGTPVVALNTCYNGATNPCPTTIPTLPISQIDTYNTLDAMGTDGTTAKYNNYGMQTESDVWDFSAGTTSRGALLRKEVWTYGYSIPSLVTEDEVFDGSGNLAGETLYGYDGVTLTASSGVPQHAAVTGARGNLTSMTQYANTTLSYASSATYEDTGTLLSSTTPSGTTTFTYDPTFVYNTGVTLPTPSSGIALGASNTYDTASTGLPLTSTDANLQVTKVSSYDAMLRPTEVDSPDGGKTTISYSPTQVGQHTYQSASVYSDSETLLDGYGRQSRVEIANGQGSNPWYQADTCYDANGNVSFTSYSYQGSGFGAAKVCSGAGDTFTYDVLGRVTGVVRANGETRSYTYLGRAVKSVDENNVTRISQVDGLGRTTIVCEISANTYAGAAPASCGTDLPGTGFATTYAYTLATPTTTITQGVQTRTFQSDWLGRPTTVTEPESGQTTYGYAYNSTGLAVTRNRPKANQPSASSLTTTTTQYDALGRVVSITYTDGTPAKTFAYDKSAGANFTDLTQMNLKGRLSLASVPTAMTAYSYDVTGRTSYLDECLPSGPCGTAANNHQLHYTYDLAGNLLTSTDGAGVTTTYALTQANEVHSMSSSLSNSTNPASLLSSVQNGPHGPISYSLGNGLTGAYSYDALGRLNGGSISSSSTQIYGYTNGWKGQQVTGSADSVLNQGSTYCYDEFNRLAARTVNSGTGPNFSWSYDRYGNRLTQTMTGGTGSGTSSSLSVSAANNQVTGYTYDAAGNMTSDGIHAYTYDADGHITAVDGGATASYVYNALGQRVRATVGSAATEYVFNAGGQRVSEWNGTTRAQLKGKYYWGGAPLAYYAGGAAHFEHSDWLGTERLRTGYNGSVEGTYNSQPWGDNFMASGADTDANHYATLDHDTESGTDHAQFRQYSEAQGRWLSPDPYSGSYDGFNPQSFNRYAYVGNSPLAGVDPSGLTLSTGYFKNSAGGGGSLNPLDPGSVTPVGPADGSDMNLDALNQAETGWKTTTVYGITFTKRDSTSIVLDENGNLISIDLPDHGDLTISVTLVSSTTEYINPGAGVPDFSQVINGPASAAPYEVAQNNAPNNGECDNACQLAHAFNKTGVYSLTSVCFPVAFYGASGTIAFSGVAAGGGYAGAESAEVITSTMKVPAVIWTNLGLSTVGAWFHKEIGSAVDSFCSHH